MLHSLLVSRVFPVSARVLARVLIIKEKTPRGTRDTFPHPRATELLSSPWHPLSDLATQPIRRPDRTPLARLGPLAPCATEPLTGDLDSVGSVDFFFSLLLVLPLWQLLVFLVFCAASLGSLFCIYLFRQCFFYLFWMCYSGCVRNLATCVDVRTGQRMDWTGSWLCVWTYVTWLAGCLIKVWIKA